MIRASIRDRRRFIGDEGGHLKEVESSRSSGKRIEKGRFAPKENRRNGKSFPANSRCSPWAFSAREDQLLSAVGCRARRAFQRKALPGAYPPVSRASSQQGTAARSKPGCLGLQ